MEHEIRDDYTQHIVNVVEGLIHEHYRTMTIAALIRSENVKSNDSLRTWIHVRSDTTGADMDRCIEQAMIRLRESLKSITDDFLIDWVLLDEPIAKSLEFVGCPRYLLLLVNVFNWLEPKL